MSNAFWAYLAKLTTVRHHLPKSLRLFVRRFVRLESYYRQVWQIENQYADAEEISSYPAKVDVRLGIIKEFAHRHQHYIGACRDLGVPYRLLDISGPNWIDVINGSGCDAFLVYPSGYITVWKQMYDERLKVILEELGRVIYPTYDELWLYESKRRMYYWLGANDIPHAKTWVFYNPDEALAFARSAGLPMVFKSNLGAGASGVRILRSRKSLLRFLKRYFRKGLVRRGGDPRDREWGSVVLQEYLPNILEWRMIRIGHSYFGYEKLRRGDFHSGSHCWRYSRPPSGLLDFVRKITEKANFSSMCLDIFVDEDNRYFVSELQSVFGMGHPYEMCVIDGQRGRMLYESDTDSWRFEAGEFCQNDLCNRRVEALLEILGKNISSESLA